MVGLHRIRGFAGSWQYMVYGVLLDLVGISLDSLCNNRGHIMDETAEKRLDRPGGVLHRTYLCYWDNMLFTAGIALSVSLVISQIYQLKRLPWAIFIIPINFSCRSWEEEAAPVMMLSLTVRMESALTPALADMVYSAEDFHVNRHYAMLN